MLCAFLRCYGIKPENHQEADIWDTKAPKTTFSGHSICQLLNLCQKPKCMPNSGAVLRFRGSEAEEVPSGSAGHEPSSAKVGARKSVITRKDLQEINAWEHWSYDWLESVCADHGSGSGPRCSNPIRHIQHQRPMDLYWQFCEEWAVRVEKQPGAGPCPTFHTFVKRYQTRWKFVLVMRKTSQHGQCKTCFDFHAVLRSKASWEVKVLWFAHAYLVDSHI